MVLVDVGRVFDQPRATFLGEREPPREARLVRIRLELLGSEEDYASLTELLLKGGHMRVAVPETEPEVVEAVPVQTRRLAERF